MMKYCLLLCFFWFLPSLVVVRAQDGAAARFSTNAGTPLVGQPVELSLIADIPTGAVVITWPEFPADWPPFDVRSVSELSISGTQYRQILTVILWIPGEYRTPETTIVYQLAGNPEPQVLSIEPAFFSVPSVLNGQDTALRPFKPQISLPYLSSLVIVVGAVGVVGLAFAAVRYLWFLRANRVTRSGAEDGLGPAAQAALAELRRIAARDLTPEQLYATAADCLRTYIHDQMTIPAHDLTTAELMESLHLPEALQRELHRLLEQADLVKFARYRPGSDSAQRYLEVAGKWVRAADQKGTT